MTSQEKALKATNEPMTTRKASAPQAWWGMAEGVKPLHSPNEKAMTKQAMAAAMC